MYKVLKIICCATKLNLLLQLSQSMTKRAANIFMLKITIKGSISIIRRQRMFTIKLLCYMTFFCS